MTFYTELERLTKTAKEGGFQKVGADVDVVLRLIEENKRAALGTQPVKETNHG